ncbi:hypothetical protein LCGC14_2611680, partial [marine sediment metagenome]
MLRLADAIAANQGRGTLMFRFHKVTAKIAKRFGPEVANTWL